MPTPSAINRTGNVPTEVFTEFLVALQNAGLSGDFMAHLRKTLLDEKTCGERALREAVLAEEPLP
jgi:hypothetical protein